MRWTTILNVCVCVPAVKKCLHKSSHFDNYFFLNLRAANRSPKPDKPSLLCACTSSNACPDIDYLFRRVGRFSSKLARIGSYSIHSNECMHAVSHLFYSYVLLFSSRLKNFSDISSRYLVSLCLCPVSVFSSV